MKFFLKLIVKRIDRRRNFIILFDPSFDWSAVKRKKLSCVSIGGKD